MEKIDKLVPDNYVITEGLLSKQLEAKRFNVKEVLVHEALLAELEYNAGNGKASGFIGLDELKNLRNLTKITFKGKRPSMLDLRNASPGEIASMAVDLAYEEDAVLITANKVQFETAQAKGIRCLLIEPKEVEIPIKLDSYFDPTTMSVHLKENVKAYAKKGVPGKWDFVPVSSKPLTQDMIKEISSEIIGTTGLRKDAFIEIEREGSTIIQLGHYRIVITRPPFSDGWEITAVKPIKKLEMKDYAISNKLMKRIEEQAEGILIAGAPGHGKSTFAQAIAEFYAAKGKIVKTVEAPRDLIVSDNITQYAISHGDPQEIHDILLLSRPDHTIFDEMRNTSDFQLFADLRLAGIGFLGVVHATNPIDAIQRFIGRTELGVIPQIIDTVVFIKNGNIGKVLDLKITVKVPSGMTEADLARPVVVVSDFETNKLEFEIYSYGEETVVIPVQETKMVTSAASMLAAKQVEAEMRKYVESVEAKIVGDNKAEVYIPEKEIPKIIGKGGKRISEIEKKIGIKIEVKPVVSKVEQSDIGFEIKERGNHFIFKTKYTSQSVDTFVDDKYVYTSITSKKGEIKLNKRSEIGKKIVDALNLGKQLSLKTSYA